MMKFCKVHKMKAGVREEAKQLLRDLNQSIELLSYEAKFKEEKDEAKKEEESAAEAKAEEPVAQTEEKRGKARVRRKRKANNNVVYDQDNIGDEFEEKEKQKCKRQKKNSDDGDEYVLEDSENPYPSKDGKMPEGEEALGAEYGARGYQVHYNQADPKLNPHRDGSHGYEMGHGSEQQYPSHDHDGASSKDSQKRRDMKRQHKHPHPGMSKHKQQLPLNLNYTEFFPIFCSLCLQKVEDNYSCWKCQGHCGKVYHEECKKRQDVNLHGEVNERARINEWLCWLCTEGKAECFICGSIDFVKWNARKKVPSYIRNNPALSAYHRYGSQGNKEGEGGQQLKPDGTDAQLVDNPVKEPHIIQNEDGPEKETEIKFRFDETPSPETDPVIKCYTGSCPRHYHLACLKKNHHRCLFNLHNQDEFKCSLHFCKHCGQTSEQSLLMQCLKCPISYHMKCSKQERYLKRLSRRHIICSTHYRPPREDAISKEGPTQMKPECLAEEIPVQHPPNVEEVPEEQEGEEGNKEIFKIEKRNVADDSKISVNVRSNEGE